ncbi:MAG: hypothetical protein QG670_1113 [Thermoproteota archaeon]|nr:hypothetical protein [Thermoproteota archaeon]
MIKGKRYHLKEKEVRAIIEKIKATLQLNITDFLSPAARFENIELPSKDKIFLIDEKPAFIESKGEFFPSLLYENILNKLPSITVDMGAIPHICNGADIMAPGIRKINGEFSSNSIIVIIEEKFSKKIALGKTLYTSLEISEKKSGRVAKNIHFVGDRFWDILKT